jgi:hypothetical protein
MRERVALLGGRFDVKSYPSIGPGSGNSRIDRRKKGRGTKISITLPVAKEPPSFSSIEPIRTKPIASKHGRKLRAVGE